MPYPKGIGGAGVGAAMLAEVADAPNPGGGNKPGGGPSGVAGGGAGAAGGIDAAGGAVAATGTAAAGGTRVVDGKTCCCKRLVVMLSTSERSVETTAGAVATG